MSNDVEWNKFSNMAAIIMKRALSNDISLEEASQFFEKTIYIENEELRDFIVRYIWEIDGFRNVYIDLIRMFENSSPIEEFVAYMRE